MSTYVTKKFTKYSIYYMSGNSSAVGSPQTAEVDCFDDDGLRSGIIYFYPDDVELPVNSETANGIYIYFRHSRFSEVINMVRVEKPLYLFIDTSTNIAGIQTGFEPVGELEIGQL